MPEDALISAGKIELAFTANTHTGEYSFAERRQHNEDITNSGHNSRPYEKLQRRWRRFMVYNRLTTREFIKRAKSVHGDKYDYSEVDYVNINTKVKIRCGKHGIFRQIAGNHINPKIKAGCPYCTGKAVVQGENDLLSQAPEVAKYFDKKTNKCTAADVFVKSNKKYWWSCDNGLNHKYQMMPNNKVNRNYGCPICSGQQLLKGFNDLQTKFPDIAKEWDYNLNENKPSEYTYGSGHKVWWKCRKCDESYLSPINIHTRGHKCPYCSGNKILSGKNDLATLFPDIATEYSEDNELPASQISAHTHKKVKWICPHCNQKYIASPHHRTSSDKTGCPYCKRQSKGECKIKKILDNYNITYKEQEWFDDLRSEFGHPLRYDFTIYKDDVWIGTVEFNGEQHYMPITVFGGKEHFDIQKQHDLLKTQYSLEHHVPILIIPYKRCGMTTEEMVIQFLKNLELI